MDKNKLTKAGVFLITGGLTWATCAHISHMSKVSCAIGLISELNCKLKDDNLRVQSITVNRPIKQILHKRKAIEVELEKNE